MPFNKATLLLLTVALLSAQGPSRSGIDRANLDPNCKPCTDFWRYANECHAAFQCKPGDPMVRPPEAQCKLW